MIEEMKKITVLSKAADKTKLILSLREFGLVHISDVVQRSEESDRRERDKALVQRAMGNLESYVDKKNPLPQIALEDDQILSTAEGIVRLMDEESRIGEKIRVLKSEMDRIRAWGDFDPKEVSRLREDGVDLHFYQVSKKDLKVLSQDSGIKYISVSCTGSPAIAVVGEPLGKEYQLTPFVLPEKSLGTLEAEAMENEKRAEEIKGIFASSARYIPSFSSWIKKEEEKILFDKVNATASDLGDICYITGYLPASELEAFRAWSGKNGTGYLVEDISEEDNPPTKLRHKGIIRIIQPLFDMLGLVPGYREKDISRYFLVFMTLFFAMIIGDAGYGLLLVALAVALNVKSKKCSDMNALLYVFGGATVIWGALTGTWFGSETIIGKVGFLKLFVLPGLTNFPAIFGMDATLVQDNMMTLCFSIGTIHLSLACVLCILDKLPKKDLSFLADLGWMINTNLLYLLVLYLVVNAKVPFGLIVGGIITGFVLVCLFSEMAPGKPFAKGLKESLGGFFTNFIDTISCFSNVMSYIRLFAVGLASLAIAQSFNGMAAGMLSGIALPAGVLILVIGHAVNLVMGFLSIVVHGVRLNIMEFSGQVGVEWSGYKYEPFSRKAK